jgi:hypothetical protein
MNFVSVKICVYHSQNSCQIPYMDLVSAFIIFRINSIYIEPYVVILIMLRI